MELQSDMDRALREPTYPGRCRQCEQVLSRLGIKDIHQVFPRLLANVFGFDGSHGWGLRELHCVQHELDFNAVFFFLSPQGFLFRLIARLQPIGDVKFEFPITCLPERTRKQLASGVVPLLFQRNLHSFQTQHTRHQQPYQNQLLGFAGDGHPGIIWLSAFEYYMFHFAYYLVYWSDVDDRIADSAGAGATNWTELGKSLYSSLLDSYSKFFLPATGDLNELAKQLSPGGTYPSSSTFSSTLPTSPFQERRQQQQPSRHPWSPEIAFLKWHGFASPLTYQPIPGLLKVGHSPSSYVPPSPSPFGTANGLGGSVSETWASETFAMVLAEFWLNRIPSDVVSVSSSFVASQVATPPQEFIRILRMFVKHLHSFGAGALRSSSMLHFRRTIIPVIFQQKMFAFLSHCFVHWPLTGTFRAVLELWLTYIQPWRYAAASGGTANCSTWDAFIQQNIPFYTTLLAEFLRRAIRLPLTDSRNTIMIFRVAKVFSQNALTTMIAQFDSTPLSPSPPLSSSFSGVDASSRSIREIKEMIELLMGDMTLTLRYLKQMNETPSSPPTTPRRTETQPLRILLSSLVGWWNTPSDGDAGRNYDKEDEMRRVVQHLEQGLAFFQSGFQISHVVVTTQNRSPAAAAAAASPLSSSLSPSPPLRRRIHVNDLNEQADELLQTGAATLPGAGGGGGSFSLPTTPPSATSFGGGISTLEPDYLLGSDKRLLSPLGRQQLMNGSRRCNSARMKPFCDPLCVPIRSYENPRLVRLWHKVSESLDALIGPTLREWRDEEQLRVRRWIARAFLSDPVPSWKKVMKNYTHTTPSKDRDDVNQTPTATDVERIKELFPGYEPRITLRILASYQTIFWLIVLVPVFWMSGTIFAFFAVVGLFLLFVVLRNI